MGYTTAEARRQLLDEIATALERLGEAIARLGVAYEALDESRGEELERALFRPVQAAYGRARRAHAGFAARHGLPARTFAQPPAPAAWHGPRELVDGAADAVADADATLAELQDSLLPVEVGDPELRKELADVRALLAPLERDADALLRRLWR